MLRNPNIKIKIHSIKLKQTQMGWMEQPPIIVRDLVSSLCKIIICIDLITLKSADWLTYSI